VAASWWRWTLARFWVIIGNRHSVRTLTPASSVEVNDGAVVFGVAEYRLDRLFCVSVGQPAVARTVRIQS
jgi:hypothetical protein